MNSFLPWGWRTRHARMSTFVSDGFFRDYPNPDIGLRQVWHGLEASMYQSEPWTRGLTSDRYTERDLALRLHKLVLSVSARERNWRYWLRRRKAGR